MRPLSLLSLIFHLALSIFNSKGPNYHLVSAPISGVSMIKLGEGTDLTLLVFSGCLTNVKFEENMKIIKPQFYGKDSISYLHYSTSSTKVFPSSRSWYGMVNYTDSDLGDTAIVFGGIGTDGVYGDMWQYEYSRDHWKVYSDSFELPLYNFGVASFKDSDGKAYAYIVGGIDHSLSFSNHTYQYNFNEKSKTTLEDYTSCTNLPLLGLSLSMINSTLYLMGGINKATYTLSYFKDICAFENSKWTLTSLPTNSLSLYHGGTCAYQNYIYYFFGKSMSKGFVSFNSSVYRIDTKSLSKGWQEVALNCSSSTDCARASFAYYCDNDTVYIYGGETESGPTNSFLRIDLASLAISAVFGKATHPSASGYSTLTQSANFLYLFGGVNRGEYMQDIWAFNTLSNHSEDSLWTLIRANGAYPPPRYEHAAASQGNFIIYVGGIDESKNILSDYWLFSSVDSTWTELVPSSFSVLPPPISRTCVVLDLPYFYYVGGLTVTGVTLDMWAYDMTTNEFTQIYATQITDTPVFGHSCELIKTANSSSIFTIFGIKNVLGDPYCGINMFDITDTTNVMLKVLSQGTINMVCRSNFAYLTHNEKLMILGGQIFPDFSFRDIWDITLTPNYTETYIGTLDVGLSLSAFTGYGPYLVLIGGYQDNGFSINAGTHTSIYFLDVSSGNDYCGAGYYWNSVQRACELCPPGTYSTKADVACINCPAGSYNSFTGSTDPTQCLPCPYRTYNNVAGASICTACPINQICYVGSVLPSSASKYNLPIPTQPKLLQPNSLSTQYIISGCVYVFLIAFFVLIFLVIPEIKVFSSVYEILIGGDDEEEDKEKELILKKDEESKNDSEYENKEYNEDEEIGTTNKQNKQEKAKISLVAGFLTGVAVISVIICVVIFILIAIYDNLIESVSVVPTSAMSQEYSYNSSALELDIFYFSYTGSCSEDQVQVSSQFLYTLKAIQGENYCNFKIFLYFSELFSSGSYIELAFNGFTSDIKTFLTANSSIPNEKSTYESSITADQNLVFRGNDPTIINYFIIPSYYQFNGYVSTEKQTGFRIDSQSDPTPGEQKTLDSVFLALTFSVKVVFTLGETGIATFRYYQLNIFNFLGVIAGAISGILGVFSIAALVGDAIARRKEKKRDKKKEKYQQEIQKYKKKKSTSPQTSIAK